MNILKKVALGILIASAVYAIAYFSPNIYNIGFDPVKMYENYTTYVLFLYVSIVLIYVCTRTHSRLSTMTLTALLLVNFFWITSLFTQGTLGISMGEFYALAILFLLALATSYIRYRIRFPLIVVIGTPFIIILLNHALPLYPQKPDIEGFYTSQVTTLNIQTRDNNKTMQEAETKLTIKTNDTEKILALHEGFETLELGTAETQILFSSKTGIQNTFAYITFPKGAIVELYPQSAIAIQDRTINVIQGKINIYTPQNLSGYLTLSGDLKKMLMNETGNIQPIIDEYLAKKNTYFTKQIGGEIMLNPTIDNFIGRYLNIANSASKITQNLINYFSTKRSMSSFDQNILNYNEFHTYLAYQKKQSYIATTGSTQRIARDSGKGRNATNSKARRDSLTNMINGRFGK